MGKEAKQAVEIIQRWGQFAQAHPGGSTEDFARWLLESPGQTTAPPATTEDGVVSGVPDDYYTSSLLGRIARFSILWSKKMFDGFPLRTMEEYGMLRIVQHYPDARKSDIVYHSLLEPTTCFEILKRLQRMGYLADRPDETDRRSRRVYVTKAGEQISKELDVKLVQLSKLLVGRLETDEKRALTQLLEQLDTFHENVYANHRDATLDEMVATYLPESG